MGSEQQVFTSKWNTSGVSIFMWVVVGMGWEQTSHCRAEKSFSCRLIQDRIGEIIELVAVAEAIGDLSLLHDNKA